MLSYWSWHFKPSSSAEVRAEKDLGLSSPSQPDSILNPFIMKFILCLLLYKDSRQLLWKKKKMFFSIRPICTFQTQNQANKCSYCSQEEKKWPIWSKKLTLPWSVWNIYKGTYIADQATFTTSELAFTKSHFSYSK